MSDRKEPSADNDEEPWIMATLNEAGKRTEPSEAQMQRWSAAFREARADTHTAARRRRIRTVAVAATVVLSAVLVLSYRPLEQPAPALIADVNLAIGTNQLLRPQEEPRRLQSGDALLAGDRLRTGSHGGVGLTFQESDVRLHHDTEALLQAGRIELLRGALYVDSGAVPAEQSPFVVSTRFGSVSHIGTQYLVVLGDNEMLSVVREGRITVAAGDRRAELSAERQNAALLRVSGDGTWRQEQESSYGSLWAWAERLSTGMSVAGQSPHEVLSWAARETGRTLEYADDEAAAAAAAGHLSGSSVRLSADQALRAVSASTRLYLEASEPGTLRVGLASENHHDPQ